MSSKKKWPSKSILLCEYMVGRTIASALGPIPKKPRKKRDVVTVEVFTDDETEEDTVKITYPRSGRSVKPQTTADTTVKKVKKVRFEDGPKKSALKKTPTSSESEETPTDSEANTSAESSDSKASESPSPQKSKNKKNKEKGKEAAKPPDSSDDSDPHPTCECSNCTRGRQKQQREATKASKKAQQSDSDTEATTDEEREKGQKNSGKKGKAKEKEKARKMDSVEEDSQEESAKDTDDSDNEKKKENKQQSKKNNKNKKKDVNKNEDQTQNGHNKNNNDEKPKDKDAEKESKNPLKEATETKTSRKEKESDQKKASKYPTPYPGPHPRRPNLIAPIRAEVVHTERVVETPEDPIPNAYYDAENNIVRIYHGPVYGHHHQSLYPKRDPSLHPLPIGMPHPTQNPYYHGFDSTQDKTGMQHVPITQGMAMPAWNAFAPMGFAGYPGAYPGGPWPNMEPAAQAQNQNRGAFSLVNPNPNTAAAAPSSKDQDVAGGNNVFPPGKDNPYLPNKTKSQFSGYGGSNGSVRNASPKNSSPTRIENQAPMSQPQQSGWGNGNGNDNGNGGAADTWGNQTQDNTWGDNNNGGSQQSNVGDNQGSSWNNNNNNGNDTGNNGGSEWPSGGQPSADTGTWDNQDAQNRDAAECDNAPPAEAHNNVMPCSWVAPTENPAWGDPTMAASTGGRVDESFW